MPTRDFLADARAQMKLEVVRRLNDGEALADICADPSLPRIPSLYRWAAAEPSFGADFAAARKRSDWLRRFAFHDDKAAAFLARLAAGETLDALRRDPAMPRPETLRYWRATQGAFGAEVRRLIEVHKTERIRQHFRTGRRPFERAIADRVLLHLGRGVPLARVRHVEPGLPGDWIIARWRREDPEFAEEVRVTLLFGRRARLPPRMAAILPRLTHAIAMGGSLHSLAGRKGLPSAKTLYRWVRRNRVFADAVEAACERRRLTYEFKIADIAAANVHLPWRLARRRTAHLARQAARLENRPGKRWRE